MAGKNNKNTNKITPIQGTFTLPKFDSAKPTFDFISETVKYENILFELYATQIEWDDLPEEIKRDGGELYLEKTICNEGKCLFFYDDILKEFLVHSFTGSGLNFYYQPQKYYVTGPNGYTKELDRSNAVPIYNSPYYTTEINVINNFAQKLALCDMTAMLNVNTQKLPYIVKCTQGQRLTMINLFKQLEEFNIKVLVDDDYDENSIKVYPLNSPFVAEDIYNLKSKYWQEALKFCGISIGANKKERVGEQEQSDSNEESDAMLMTRLTSRKIAAEQINKMFGLNITVKIRENEKRKQVLNESTKEVIENG